MATEKDAFDVWWETSTASADFPFTRESIARQAWEEAERQALSVRWVLEGEATGTGSYRPAQSAPVSTVITGMDAWNKAVATQAWNDAVRRCAVLVFKHGCTCGPNPFGEEGHLEDCPEFIADELLLQVKV